MRSKLAQLCLTIIPLVNSPAFGQAPALPPPFGPHQWAATVKAVGEDGNPIAGADVAVSYSLPANPSEPNQPRYGEVKGVTDANGVFKASHTDSSSGLAIVVGESGYYATHWGHQFYDDDKKRNPSFTLLLKTVGKPVAMYAKYVENGPPVFNEPVGYDLMVGDWVAPHGKGKATDIIFTGKLDKTSKDDFDYKLTVSFPNSRDGIQEFTVPDAGKGSALRSPHEAPLEGYQSEVIRAMSRHPGQPGTEDLDLSRNYFFRVRTVLDSNGNIKSALYGKIYGDFMQFHYYLNPTPNDPNIEFDPKHNLVDGLKSFEEVSAP